jgi:cytochrome c5
MQSKHLLVYMLALAAAMPGILRAQASAVLPAVKTMQPYLAQQAAAAPTHNAAAAQNSAKSQPSEGETIFHQRCGNCHNAPEGFSPRISGTVVRHMRVRASLSKHEEEELLRFFNP